MTKAIQRRITASDKAITMKLSHYELKLVCTAIERAYRKIKLDGVPQLKENDTLSKDPLEVMVIELCYNAMVKFKKKLAEDLTISAISLPVAETCALWELYRYGYLYYNVDDAAITSLFTEVHPQLS
ncbi:MAG: hypothetical protein F9K23_00800 [Bacteroidetes bacterium]|nr:MAG: hypothetical protein F9K23_00800 [Bacteroidota bacterium]